MPVKKSTARRCTLPGKSIGSVEDFYEQISRKLGFPATFGRNLDALWDVLTTDVEGPVKIFWKNSAFSKDSMGKDFERISALLRDVAKEREDIEVVFE